MTEGRTSVGEPDAEVERTSTDTGTPTTEHTDAESTDTTGHASGDHASGDTAEPVPGEDGTASADPTTPAVGNASADDAGSRPGDTVPAASVPGGPDAADEGRHSAAEGADEEWADAEDRAYQRELRKGLAFGLAGGLVVGAIVALLLGAFVYPGYLGGPGSPDDTANQVVTALAAKDAPALEQASCKGADGASISQLSPQVLQLIASVKPTGPTTQVIDTEARTPVDLALSYQGQSQTLPSEIVLGQTQGSWCLKGLAQRQ